MGVIPCAGHMEFSIGNAVIVRKGKHKGMLFVVVGMEGEDRVLIADGKHYTVERPKKKNKKHLQRTLVNLEDVAGRVAGGKPLDNGWLVQKIAAISDNSNTSCRQGG